MEDGSFEKERFYHIFSIVLIGVGSYCCLLGLVLLRNVCRLHGTKEFTPEELIRNKDLLPKSVKVVGKVDLTSPLTSRIGKQPNCLRYRSKLIYHYNKLEQVWEPRHPTYDADYRINGHTGGYYRNEVRSFSLALVDEKRTAPEFDLVGKDGSSRISVETGEPISVELKDDGKLQHTVKRGGSDSSYTELRCSQNPNVCEHMGRLPVPHSKSSFEIYEKWNTFEEDDDRLISVYGVASERDGTVIIAAGGFNNRMLIEDGSAKWVCLFIVVWVFAILTLPTGLFFFLKPETVELLPWWG